MSEKVMPVGASAPVKKKKKEGMWEQSFKRLLKIPTATFGMAVLVLLVVISLCAPIIAPYGYEEMDLVNLNAAPSAAHLCGTDALGRDCFSRLIYGGRYSITLGFSASLMSMFVGILLGSLAGYCGGRVETIIMRCCDVLQAIPGMLLSIVVSSTLGTGFVNTVLALAIGGMSGSIRMLRSQILSVRKEEYLEAALSVNCSPFRIMFKHLLPNVLSPVIVSVTMGMGNTIMAAANLSVLGLGVQPPTPEWGAMLSSGRNYIRNYPHLIIFPGIMIFITVLCFNLFGDGLRDAIDPKLKK